MWKQYYFQGKLYSKTVIVIAFSCCFSLGGKSRCRPKKFYNMDHWSKYFDYIFKLLESKDQSD